MLTYTDVRDFLSSALTGLGYADSLPLVSNNPKSMPLFDPGPVSLTSIFTKSPGTIAVVTVGNGAGLTLEQTYDQVFITVRVVGPQFDYSAAEQITSDIDRAFLAVNSSRMMGQTRVLYVTRTGGAPQLIDFDSTDRYHFQTTYITPAATGL